MDVTTVRLPSGTLDRLHAIASLETLRTGVHVSCSEIMRRVLTTFAFKSHPGIFAATQPGDGQVLRGYVMAGFYQVGFVVRELAVLPEDTVAVPPLLAAVVAEAARRGIPLRARVSLPQDPSIDEALADLFGPTLHSGEDHGHLMARTVSPDFDDWQLDAIFTAPGASYSYIDHF